jgi:serine protease Do
MERVILRHLKGSKASQIEEFPLHEFAQLTIGRDPSSGVRFDPEKDDLVGRQHARISREPSEPYRFTLQDLNSRNGTFLNKLRVVGEMPLQPGDVIQLGAGGPELQFDIDPLPAMYVKATRVGVAGATAKGVAETRVGPTANASLGASASVSQPQDASITSRPPNTVGKATVERMIGETKKNTRRNMLVSMAAVAVLVAGVALYGKSRMDAEARQSQGQLASMRDSIARASEAALTEIADRTERSIALAANLQPSEIAERYGPAVVQVDFSWKLIYTGTGGQLYHMMVPNQYEAADGSTRPLFDNGRQFVPAWVQVEGTIEPYLTLDQNSGRPIGVSSRGSGFVVTSSGFILTNRHVAYNWQAYYSFDPNDIGPVMDLSTGKPLLDANGNPVLTQPPLRWHPSETKQAGPKGEIGSFQARMEYLYVRFPKDPTPFEASLVRPSQRHDVALIKVDAPSSLTYVELKDTYNETKQGDPVTVMGYPGMSPDVISVIKSRDMFNREAQARILPEPTLSVGNIGKILRAADAEVRDGFGTFAPSGDTYQLTVNSTGGGNSGGPMFDAFGNVIGIYFAGSQQISFAIPIRYGMELLRIGDPTAN